ncbi:MAG TPA: hypothetical protein VKE71_08165 [Candidatus Angelobacter sp.]|nr:hypothetical protein [Candidatus Angelobacter sp.]
MQPQPSTPPEPEKSTQLACSVLSPHSFRHTYRAWLDELDTPITVQQRAIRHGDIRVTMNYGDAIGEGLLEA